MRPPRYRLSAEEARPVGAGLKSASVAAAKAPPGIIARVLKVGYRTRGPCGQTWRGWPNVRLPYPIAGFRVQGRFSQLSAINRHNKQLFDDLVGDGL